MSWGLYSPFDYIKFYCIDLNEFVQLSVTYPVEGFLDMKSASWLTGHIHAFEYFGGVPESLVPDN
ncbi:MAG: hypothetical protein WAW98_06185, partial [Trichococcus flocculiformis]